MTEKKQGISGTLRNSYALRRSMLIHLGVSLILFLVILIFTFQTTVVSANTRELAEAQSSLNQAEMLNNTYIRSISDYMIQAMNTYEVQGLLYSAGFTNYLSIRSRNVYEGLADVSDLVIVEVKQDGTLPSKFKDFLRDARVKKKGLSKYCLGMLLTEEHLKYNRFKDKIRYVNKLTDKNYKIKSLE